MLPYENLAEIVKHEPGKTFRDEWMGFANWEALRYFHDDPGRRSKDTIRWLLHFNELCTMIENDYSGPGKERCLQAMETAFVAFSQLDLPAELCNAIQEWRAYRQREELADKQPTTIGEDLLPKD
jgi:hypothetical protein